jgi:hypothetical protein
MLSLIADFFIPAEDQNLRTNPHFSPNRSRKNSPSSVSSEPRDEFPRRHDYSQLQRNISIVFGYLLTNFRLALPMPPRRNRTE